MYYPKNVFSAREDITRARMKEHDRKRDLWYKTALQMYPDYYKMDARTRIEARKLINEKAGFSLS